MSTQINLIIIVIVCNAKPKYIYTPLALPLLLDSRFQKENLPLRTLVETNGDGYMKIWKYSILLKWKFKIN